jgi:hypothetical protein
MFIEFYSILDHKLDHLEIDQGLGSNEQRKCK